MRMIYGTYKANSGEILVRTPAGYVDMVTADPWTVLGLRRTGLGYVSQFLNALPRISALEVVTEPLVALGVERSEAERSACHMLERLDIDRSLWSLSPLTFSGGEQQRVNIARAFISHYDVLLLDEPTASLDPTNRDRVIEIIRQALERGSTIIGIFHDQVTADQILSRRIQLSEFQGELHAQDHNAPRALQQVQRSGRS
ncbi:alpha-D-ribose 1-methylphosphonate 5-triphosphate synthase subunit PhnL [Bradyrhizobium sp. CIR48]|nr:alpha-D-ribose 1-methylphosphonate 5-triphosphate synthase subunit PhnL [Bradyrhizobium sp. CIR48]